MNRYIIWGTGVRAVNFYKFYETSRQYQPIEIVGFIDNNPGKWGEMFLGNKIYSPQEIKKLNFDYIDIWMKDVGNVKKQLVEELGIEEEKIKSCFDILKDLLKKKYHNTEDDEIHDFLKIMDTQYTTEIFSYHPVREDMEREMVFDDNKAMYYVDFEGKRLYLASSFQNYIVKDGKRFARNLWQEQDENSPHLYTDEIVAVKKGDIIVDAGACEGNFTLHNIDKIKKAYLIECDEEWMRALQATFEPYKDKIVFCNKFLSNYDSDMTIKLDSLIEESVDFIKMDIEGEEINALLGAEKIFSRSSSIKCAVCSYHRHGDKKRIKEILEKYGLYTYPSKGYMFFIYDDSIWENPELRRGIVRGYKR